MKLLNEPISRATKDVLAERERQVLSEGRLPRYDDDYKNEELARAAACYALPHEYREIIQGYALDKSRQFIPPQPRFWPWSAEWWKPSSRRRDLVKAAALLIAEIERIDRAEQLGNEKL